MLLSKIKASFVWNFWILFFSFSLLRSLVFAIGEDIAMDDVFVKGVEVNLREPEYCDGVLKTQKGGVITGPDMRIQAQNIVYTRKVVDGKAVYKIEAEENVMLEFGEYLFIGQRLEYDFQEKTGVIYNGRTAVEPWFFGGQQIILCADGSYIIRDGYVTTSENYNVDWEISSEEAILYPNHDISAKNVKFKFVNVALLWLPSFKANLDYIFDSPIRYAVRWGGKQGPRASMIYEVFSWNRWKTFLRLDYRLTRGPGIGFETYYRSLDHRENFEAINYVARDSSIEHPSEKFRYRFQGLYTNSLFDDRVSVNLTYDKLSDKYMATDYNDSSLDIEYAGVTQLQLRRQDYNWIANFLSTVRINGFQTIKQDLPTLETTWRPISLASTGIITDFLFRASYLDFKYADDLVDVHDYNSTRVEYNHRLYRPFQLGVFNATPEIAGILIYYGNTPEENNRWLTLGKFSCELNTHFYKSWPNFKHVITPYTRYEYFTYPTSSPDQHFIFDIDDGWYRLNMLRFGVHQNFYIKDSCGLIHRYMMADLYANAFFDTPTIPQTIPKIYAAVTFNTSPTLRHIVDTAWDFEESRLDHYNWRTEWTVNTNMAVAAEFRHRDAFDWRKVDHTNYILDSFHTIDELLASSLSDRRDTLLMHLFYKFHPKWALEFQTRNGWDRITEPSYTEFEIDLLGTIRSAWHVKLSYQHKENDKHRFAVYLNIGLTRPDKWKYDHLVPEVEF